MPNFIRCIHVQDNSPVPVADVPTVRRLAEQQVDEWQEKKLKPLYDVSQIFDCPERILRLAMTGIVKEPEILLDKGTGEFLELKVRGTKLPNRFMMVGVHWMLVTQDAADWARSQLSGRTITGLGKIKNETASGR